MIKQLSQHWHLWAGGAILSLLCVYSLSAMSKEQVQNMAEPGANEIYQRWLAKQQGFVKPSEEMLKKTLSPLQYTVTQEDETERPFKNTYWDNKQPGIYVDIISGEPLFSSQHKYKSGTGWPSFFRPIADQAMITKKDRLLIFVRTELRSQIADSHLGHVFDDGPAPTGKRYCINSAALRFIPKEEMAQEGYGDFLVLFSD